ncbi:polysaccharide deacetylase family protein [Bacillus carboniphilus]|uniref:Polysaccharide deacetylase family protein n=1 Tax=Bacillus carboniphilus TaxID=86663 RepID=A0ABY9JT28_9BACI|nr:polysaccharide deacetylase family protein [Bacillus carboniphilus]WLR42536.1 polysaccharide deacetylase family protein [Bacillus carboniphilus]
MRTTRLKLIACTLMLALLSGSFIFMIQLLSEDTKAIEKIDRKNWSQYPGLLLETRTKETDFYTFSISYPVSENQELNSEINDWVEDQKTLFLKKVEENKEILNENYRASFSVKVDTNQLSDQMYSLVFSSYLFPGGANGKQSMKVFNINTSTNEFIHIDDVFKDRNSMKPIGKLIQNEMDNNEILSANIDRSMLEQKLNSPEEWNWSMDSDQFYLYFDEYEIAPGAMGPVVLNLPMDQVKPHLKPKIAEGINGSPKEPEEQKKEKEAEPLDPDGKYIALTFDDGPSPKATPEILRVLDNFNVKATFFMLGSQVEYYPDLAKEVAERGHEIANHTQNHVDLTHLNKESVRKQIVESKQIITDVTGVNPNLIRPPYGAFNRKVEEVASLTNSPLILWSVDSLDWKLLDPSLVSKVVEREAKTNSIVLLHDIHPSTAEALPDILKVLQKDGYQLVTISQLLTLPQFDSSVPVYGSVR